MASILNGALLGLSNFRTGQWTWDDVANGVRSGYGNGNYFFNAQPLRDNPSGFFPTSLKIIKTVMKAHRLAPEVPFLASHTTAMKCIGAFWILAHVNMFIPRREETYLSTRCAQICEITPYALLALNLLFTTLELRTKPTKALTGFVILGIATLMQRHKLPVEVSFGWNWALPITARSVAFYCGDAWRRSFIAFETIFSLFRLKTVLHHL